MSRSRDSFLHSKVASSRITKVNLKQSLVVSNTQRILVKQLGAGPAAVTLIGNVDQISLEIRIGANHLTLL